MAKFKITKKGDYASSNVVAFLGSKRKALEFLRIEAAEMRRSSRQLKNLPDEVSSISDNLHPSKLVTMASYKLNQMDFDKLIPLMNAHGVIQYSVEEV